MTKRANQSPEARDRERAANRDRMAIKRKDPVYRKQLNATRKNRDRERKSIDPDLRPRLTLNSKRYYDSRKDDLAFWKKRKEYFRRWKAERFIDEEFEAFMARIEAGHD